MDKQLKRVIKLNEKRRQYHDGLNVNPEEFSIFDVMEDEPAIVDVDVMSHSRDGIDFKQDDCGELSVRIDANWVPLCHVTNIKYN